MLFSTDCCWKDPRAHPETPVGRRQTGEVRTMRRIFCFISVFKEHLQPDSEIKDAAYEPEKGMWILCVIILFVHVYHKAMHFFNEVLCIFFYMTPSLSTSLNMFPSVIYFVLNLCYEELILSGYRCLKCSFVLHLAFNKSVNS